MAARALTLVLVMAGVGCGGDPGYRPVGVRGQEAKAAYAVKQEVVFDRRTRLEWERRLGPPRSWEDAGRYCHGIRAGGHQDWRLPGPEEFRSITVWNTYRGQPAIDVRVFPGTPAARFWTSETSERRNRSPGVGGLVVDLGDRGAVPERADPLSSVHYVRCVRGPG